VKLINAGMSGSIIKSSIFSNECYKNTFINTKLDSCQIDGCEFKHINSEDFQFVNFSKSIITNTIFFNCKILAANFTDAMLINVTFEDCTWESVSLENTVFINSKLISVKMNKLNFEFSQFHNITLYDVRLPFPTIPYIMNGLSYLSERSTESDKIWVSSASADSNKMSLKEYFDCLDDLEIFYNKIHENGTLNYFPLANIYICKKQFEKAFSAIMMGFDFSIRFRDYRSIYYYCKLLQITKGFDEQHLIEANRFISKSIKTKGWDIQTNINYTHYIDLIRNTLMNERLLSSSLRLNINTNVSHTEHEKLTIIIKIIDDIVDLTEEITGLKVKHYIEIRRGSYDLFANYFGDNQTLLTILGLIQFTLFGTSYFISKIIKNILVCNEKSLSNKKVYLENKKLELEIQKERQKFERKSEKMNKKIKDSKIKIKGSHTLLDNNNEIDDPDILFGLYES